jgi:hypothetical protein
VAHGRACMWSRAMWRGQPSHQLPTEIAAAALSEHPALDILTPRLSLHLQRSVGSDVRS